MSNIAPDGFGMIITVRRNIQTNLKILPLSFLKTGALRHPPEPSGPNLPKPLLASFAARSGGFSFASSLDIALPVLYTNSSSTAGPGQKLDPFQDTTLAGQGVNPQNQTPGIGTFDTLLTGKVEEMGEAQLSACYDSMGLQAVALLPDALERGARCS